MPLHRYWTVTQFSITTAPQITPADALLVDLTPFSVKVINKAIPVHLTLKSAYLDTGNHRKQLD
nr:hypothetical protein [Lactiplantibacillus plantarum]